MPYLDYAFKGGVYEYEVDRIIYDKHRSYDYERGNFQHVPLLRERLRNIDSLNLSEKENFWKEVFSGNSRPIIKLGVRGLEKLEKTLTVDFLVDTGATVSMLTAKTATVLDIDRNTKGGDVIKIVGFKKNISAIGLSRWIGVSLEGYLHPIPVLVPPADDPGPESNILGRAAITSCFLMCFDNKRVYTFPRRKSEPDI